MTRKVWMTGVTAAVLFLVACAGGTLGVRGETMEVASALTKLSAAAEAYARYETVPAGITEEQFLINATVDDPGILAFFTGHKLRAHWADRHAIVLVCDDKGAVALIEDAGCSAPMDKYFPEDQPAPCEFTLSAKEICGE